MHDLAIVGGGPAGLLCALSAARHMSVALVLDERAGTPESRPHSIEAVPAPLFALLIEFGVSPRGVGVEQLHRERVGAWLSATPTVLVTPTTAHLVRPRLEVALLQRALSTQRISAIVAKRHRIESADGYWYGSGWCARRLIDATGRRALTAQQRIRPTRPWVAHLWTMRCPRAQHAGALRTAALRDGYAYRLGTERELTVGLVGPDYHHVRSAADLADILQAGGASWLIEGLEFDERERATTRVASVQWVDEGKDTPPNLLRVGDAALARDALSSQGLATSLSDALCAVAALRTANGADLLCIRHRQQRRAHLTALSGYASSHRWHSSPAWLEYTHWLGHAPRPNRRAVVVRDGELRLVPTPNQQIT